MKGFVYKIESDCKSICYIGSTTQKLKDRFKDHKKRKTCVIGKYLDNDEYMFSNGCELIKEYEISDRKHLLAYEQLWINKTKCINYLSAIKIKPVWNSFRKLKSKQWRAENQDYIKQYRVDYREKNKEMLCAQSKEYREKNRERLRAYQNERIKCDICSKEYTRSNRNWHYRLYGHESTIGP